LGTHFLAGRSGYTDHGMSVGEGEGRKRERRGHWPWRRRVAERLKKTHHSYTTVLRHA
jgi:hypothetical protein